MRACEVCACLFARTRVVGVLAGQVPCAHARGGGGRWVWEGAGHQVHVFKLAPDSKTSRRILDDVRPAAAGMEVEVVACFDRACG